MSNMRRLARYATGQTYFTEMRAAEKLNNEVRRLKTQLKRLTKRRNAQIAKIHILAGQQDMDTRDQDPESTYRQMLRRIAGVTSTSALDANGRLRVIQHLGGGHTQPPKSTPQARLIHHLWGCLADAGAVQVREGLPAWLRHFTAHMSSTGQGWERPEFLPGAAASKVIEQIKLWAKRANVDWEKGR